MKRRRLSWIPTRLLELVVEFDSLSTIALAAGHELWFRATEDEVRAAANENDGPWPVSIPRGCN